MQSNQIGSKSLTELYSLSFSAVIGALSKHYNRKYGGYISIIIKQNTFHILKNGSLLESVRMDKIDYIFNQIDVKLLRKQLKIMKQ